MIFYTMKKNLEFILKVIWSHKNFKAWKCHEYICALENQSSCSEDTCLGGEGLEVRRSAMQVIL